MLPHTHKLISLIFISTGGVSYIPTTFSHKLFFLTKLYGSAVEASSILNKLQVLNKYLFIDQDFFLLKQLPRNKAISLLEVTPGGGVQYVRAPGTSARMFKLDTSTGLALIRLPSGVRKVFSMFSIGSLNSVPLAENRY